MTTGATGQLGLALPVQGELSGTWGDTVNNGITEYTNIAIAGTLTLTGDGAVTLANTTGDASASNITSTLTGAGTVTAQFAIVRVTGTLTVAKVVTGPAYSKTYTVVNAATGGIVTFKAAGQTGVSVAVGESAFVYFNGTDYVKVAGTAAVSSFSAGTTGFTPNTATTGAVTLAGTLATTNGGTGLTSFTSGGVVYASSTSALATGSGFTYNGTSAQIGDSLSAADGSSFYVYGNIPVSTQLGIKIAGNATTYAQQAIRFYDTYSEQYAGYVGFTPSSLTFGQGTTEGMRLTSTGLGIGTSSPSTSLTVSGANTAARGQVSVIGASSADARITLYRGSTLAGAISNTATQMYVLAAEAVPLVFYTSDTERLRIPADAAGITFPASQSASSDANTLDDYEEGTWEPVITGAISNPSVTYSVQNGFYCKIGRTIIAQGRIGTSAWSGGSGDLRVSLPFVANSTSGFRASGSCSYILNITNGGSAFVPQVGENTNYMVFYKYTDADQFDTEVPANANTSGTTQINFTLVYQF